jgi:hypothetical protein
MVVVLPVRERDGLGVGMGVGGGLSPDRMLSAFIAGAYPQSHRSSHVLTTIVSNRTWTCPSSPSRRRRQNVGQRLIFMSTSIAILAPTVFVLSRPPRQETTSRHAEKP